MSCFNDPATTEISTLSLHDALPIFDAGGELELVNVRIAAVAERPAVELAMGGTPDTPARATREVTFAAGRMEDRKSTRLNSSHPSISYAVFCLKKKNQNDQDTNKRA